METKDVGKGRFSAGFSRFVQILMGTLFLLIGALVVAHGVLRPTQYDSGRYYCLALLFLGVVALMLVYLYGGRAARALEVSWLERARQCKALPWVGFAALLLVCFVLRAGMAVAFHVNPEVDFYTMYHTGEVLAEDFDIAGLDEDLSRYLALFPHIFGYGTFLSLVFSLFGAHVLPATVANAVLSTISLALLYYLGWKLSGHGMALTVGALWCFYPSQALYNLQVMSEPYYTMLLIASMALIAFLRDRLASWAWWKLSLVGILLGLVLSIANSARPIAAIVIIALAVVLFVIQPVGQHAHVGRKGLVFLCLCATFLVGNAVNSWVFTLRVGEAPATLPGFNMLVGFNQEESGTWNSEDSGFLTEWDNREGISAKEVQNAMLDAALERITSGDVNFPKLLYNKLMVLWEADDSAVGYAQNALPAVWAWAAVSNGYYYLLWLLAMGGMLHLLRQKGKSLWYLFPLFVVGLTMAHMLVEVAQRYHYSGSFCLVMLAGLGLGALWKQAREREAQTQSGD